MCLRSLLKGSARITLRGLSKWRVDVVTIKWPHLMFLANRKQGINLMRDVEENYGWVASGSSDLIGPPENTTTWLPDPIITPTTYFLRRARGRSDVVLSDHVSPTSYRAYRVDGNHVHRELSYDNWTYSYFVVPGTYTRRYWIRRYWDRSSSISKGYFQQGMTTTYHPSIPVGLLNEARTKALNKMNESGVNLGESLGDARQSGQMMANRLASLVNAFKAAKRGNAKAVANALGVTKPGRGRSRHAAAKTASNMWLEFQFGWLPLMNDIFTASEAVKKAFSRDTFFKVYASSKGTRSPDLFTYFRMDGTITAGCEVGITMKVTDASKSAMSSLGLANPLDTAWQLLPNSFVVDWFISVGDFLSALGSPLGLEFHSGYETLHTRGDYSIQNLTTLGTNKNNIARYDTYKVKNFAMERRPFGALPPPGLYMKSGLNFGKAVTSMALLNRKGHY